MAKKTGLGKGLDALFSESMLQPEEEENVLKDGEEIVKSIKIIDIEPNRDSKERGRHMPAPFRRSADGARP